MPSGDSLAALEELLTWWTRVEYLGAGAVLIGVLGEFINDFTHWWRSARRLKRLGRGSTLLLIGGLAVELVALVRTNTLAARLVEAERGRRVALELKVARTRHELALQRRWGKEDRKGHREDVRPRALHNAWRVLEGDTLEAFNRMLDGKPKGTVVLAYQRRRSARIGDAPRNRPAVTWVDCVVQSCAPRQPVGDLSSLQRAVDGLGARYASWHFRERDCRQPR